MELNKKNLRSIFLGVAGCIILYWLLHETERLTSVMEAGWGVISPFVVGAAIAFILNVPMRGVERLFSRIQRAGLRRGLAILVTVLLVLLVLVGVIYLLIPQLVLTVESLIATLPAFLGRVQTGINAYLADNPQLMTWLTENTDFATINWSGLIEKAVALITNSVTSIVDRVFTAVVSVGTGVVNGVLSLVFSIYCLSRKEILARQGRRLLYAFLPEKVSDETVRIFRMTNATFSNFISGQCLEALILGSMFAVTMPIFRMPYMPLVSVIIAVTALVPIVGAFLGCIVGAFFILVQDPLLAVWFVVLFLVLQQIEGNLIYPRVVGTSIGLPGMWVLVAVALGGDLMGVGGMLLMIPLASVLYALAREITDKRLLARGIPREKVTDQPPILQSKLRKRQPARKKKQEQQAENKDT